MGKGIFTGAEECFEKDSISLGRLYTLKVTKFAYIPLHMSSFL